MILCMVAVLGKYLLAKGVMYLYFNLEEDCQHGYFINYLYYEIEMTVLVRNIC